MASTFNPLTGRFEFNNDAKPSQYSSVAKQSTTLRFNPLTGRFEAPKPNVEVTPTQPVQQPGLLSRIGRGAGNLVKEVALAPFRAAATPFAIGQQGILGLAGKQKRGDDPTALQRFALGPGKVGSREQAFGAVERAIDVGSLFLGGSAVAQAGKNAAKGGFKAGASQFAKQAFKPKALATDIGVGTAFGVTQAGQQEGATGKDFAKGAAVGAGLGLVAPIALGAGAKATGGLLKSVGRTTAGALDDVIAKQVGRTESAIKRADDTFSQADVTSAGRNERLLKGLQTVREAPQKLTTRFINPNKPLKAAGVSDDIIDSIERESSQSTALANKRVDQFDFIMKQAGGDKKLGTPDLLGPVAKLASRLNSLDRKLRGLDVEGGRTQASLEADINKILQSPDGPKIQQLQTQWQNLLAETLEEALEVGRISKKQFDDFRAAHPNYLPNVVQDFLDNPNTFATSRGLEVGKFKGAKGSKRRLQDPRTSTIQYLHNETVKNNQVRTLKTVLGSLEDEGLEKFGIEKKRSLEQILEKKDLITSLKSSKPLRDQLETLLQKHGTVLRALIKEKNKLSRKGIKGATAPRKGGEVVFVDFPGEGKGITGNIRKFVDAWLVDPNKTRSDVARIQKSIGLREDKINALVNDITSLQAGFVALKQKRGAQFVRAKEISRETALPKKIDLLKQKQDTIRLLVDGEETLYTMPSEMAYALKQLDPTDIGIIGNLLETTAGKVLFKMPADFLRGVATKYNPMFALVRNPIRDIQNARITSNVGLHDFVWSATAGLANAIAPKSKLARSYVRAMERAQRSGGILGVGIYGSEATAQGIMRKASDNGNIISTIVRHPLRSIEDLGGAVENNVRLAVFMSEIRKGSTPEVAAKMSRNATADFSKAGRWTKDLNKVIPYLNARIRGVDSLAMAVKADPVGTARRAMYNAAYPALVLNRMNSQFESYDNIPTWEKRSYWIIMTGEVPGKTINGDQVNIPLYIKIPKGEAQQIVSAVADRMLDATPEESLPQFLGDLAGSVSPVALSQGPFGALAPQSIKVAAELSTNYNFFTQKEIIPDFVPIPGGGTAPKEALAPGRRVNYNTSQISKALGGLLNVSPAKLDHALRQGVLRDAFDGVDHLLGEANEPMAVPTEQRRTFDLSNKIGARAFFGSNYYGEILSKKEADLLEQTEKVESQIQEFLLEEQNKRDQSVLPTEPAPTKSTGFFK